MELSEHKPGASFTNLSSRTQVVIEVYSYSFILHSNTQISPPK